MSNGYAAAASAFVSDSGSSGHPFSVLPRSSQEKAFTMAVEKLGQWRQELSGMTFPRWSRVTGALGGSKKVKTVPAVDPADSNIELADFQGMPRCYESGSEFEDLLSSDVSVSSSQTCASTPSCKVQDHSKKLLSNGSPPITGSLVAPSRLSSA